MPRATYPHSRADVERAVDGPLGLVVGDVPDGSMWMLSRQRKSPGYLLVHYADTARSRELSRETIVDRLQAIDALSRAIGLD